MGQALACLLALGGPAAAEMVSKDYGAVTYRPAPTGPGLVVEVNSLHGWTCSGQYDPPARRGAAVDFPLTCSDEVEGKALMSIEDGRAALLFQRKDGSKGSAAFAVE